MQRSAGEYCDVLDGSHRRTIGGAGGFQADGDIVFVAQDVVLELGAWLAVDPHANDGRSGDHIGAHQRGRREGGIRVIAWNTSVRAPSVEEVAQCNGAGGIRVSSVHRMDVDAV